MTHSKASTAGRGGAAGWFHEGWAKIKARRKSDKNYKESQHTDEMTDISSWSIDSFISYYEVNRCFLINVDHLLFLKISAFVA